MLRNFLDCSAFHTCLKGIRFISYQNDACYYSPIWKFLRLRRASTIIFKHFQLTVVLRNFLDCSAFHTCLKGIRFICFQNDACYYSPIWKFLSLQRASTIIFKYFQLTVVLRKFLDYRAFQYLFERHSIHLLLKWCLLLLPNMKISSPAAGFNY